MADVAITKSKSITIRGGQIPSSPVIPETPTNPVTPPSTLGIGITLNGRVIGGVKRFIEENDILDIPNYWEYNVFDLDVDGRIDIDENGMINILDLETILSS
jgi:hypothetical protein